MVAQFHFQASWLQVSVESVAAMVKIQDYVVATDRFQCNGYGAGIFSRNIFWNPILDFGHCPVSHGQSIRAVSTVIFVIFFISGKSFAVGVEPYPVDGKALRYPHTAFHRNQRTPMS